MYDEIDATKYSSVCGYGSGFELAAISHIQCCFGGRTNRNSSANAIKTQGQVTCSYCRLFRALFSIVMFAIAHGGFRALRTVLLVEIRRSMATEHFVRVSTCRPFGVMVRVSDSAG
jgi:hypothetical protein